jgi:Sulfotransferase family
MMRDTALKWMIAAARRLHAPDWVPTYLRKIFGALIGKLVHRSHAITIDGFISGRSGNLDDIASFIITHVVPLRAPLVLVSQAQRSGGSLLSQLFDGHPALAAHPGELPENWPVLDPHLGVEANFRLLFNLKLGRQTRRGYVKGGDRLLSDEGLLIDRNPERHRFFEVPRVRYLVFKNLFEARTPKCQRDVFDYYFTAFFNAWLDYQGRLDGKKWISGFAPRFAFEETRVAAFFGCYPDGRLIQIIRDPRSWYGSAKKHRVLGPMTREQVLYLWMTSAESMLRNRNRYGDRVIILTFEDLVGYTEPVMRGLASKLSIDFDPILLDPTFNGQRIRANSSVAVKEPGITRSALARGSILSDEEVKIVDRQCASLYDAVAGICWRV